MEPQTEQNVRGVQLLGGAAAAIKYAAAASAMAGASISA
jgi:hypothetical protein